MRQLEIKLGVYAGNLWHHWEIRRHETVNPSGQHLSQPRRMWYKLLLQLTEAPSVVALTPQGPLAEVGLGAGLKKVGLRLVVGNEVCVCGFRQGLSGNGEKVLLQYLVRGLRFFPLTVPLVSRSWPGAHVPRLSSRSFPLPGRQFS